MSHFIHQGAVYKRAQHVTEVLDYTRLSCYHSSDRMEVFLLKTNQGYAAASAVYFGSLSLDVLAHGSEAQAKHAYELFLENSQADVGGKYGCEYKIVPTKGLDDQAERALKVLQDPTWGPNWDEKVEDYDPETQERDEFYTLLDGQLNRWKGSWNPIQVMKHRYWPRFHAQVVQAVRRTYGDDLRLYRGVYGPVAREILNGGPLPIRHLTSWTSSKRYAKDFVLTTPGGSNMGRDQDWVTLVAAWTPEDVMFAPVLLPDFTPDPTVLVDAFVAEDEFVVLSEEKELHSDWFRVVHKTRRKYDPRAASYREAGDLQQVPTWEDVWDNLQSFKGMELESEVNSTLYDVMNVREDDPNIEQKRQEAAQEVEDFYHDRYNDTVKFMQDLDGLEVWRAMVLPEAVDPRTLDPIGIYWAFDEGTAEAHWADQYEDHWSGQGEGRNVVYRAKVDASEIDMYGTIEARMVFVGSEEDEVRFYEGVPIHIYDVTLEDGTVLPVNDWRTT